MLFETQRTQSTPRIIQLKGSFQEEAKASSQRATAIVLDAQASLCSAVGTSFQTLFHQHSSLTSVSSVLKISPS